MPEEKGGSSLHSESTRTENTEAERLKQYRPPSRYEGPIAPIVATIAAFIAWSIFILIYALYWSVNFNLFQNIIVTIVSLMVTGLSVGLMWVVLQPRGAWRGT